MVNITKPPRDNVFNNYNTIGKEIKEHKNLFPKVGPIDFSTYKQRTSTINYDIIQAAMDAQLHQASAQDGEDGESLETLDDTQEQAMQFQSLLQGGNANMKKSDKGVRFAINVSESEPDDLQIEFADHHIDDEEDKKKLQVRRKLFTTLRGARDSLAIIRPQFGVPELVKFKIMIPEPEPIFAVDILVQRLANIYLPFQPPNSNVKYIEEQCDVIITVRKSLQVQDTERILCHSKILSKSSNAFKELFDLYVWDMELQEKHDIHCATTTDEGVWRVVNRVIPVNLPCHVHLEETTQPPPIIKKKLSVHPVDPYCSRHETFEDWIDPKDEDRKCEEAERASDYEPEEHPLYEDYRKLVEEELGVDAEEFVRKQSIENVEIGESAEENTSIHVAPEEEPPIEEEDSKFNPLDNLPKDMELKERHKIEADALLKTCKPFLQSLATSETRDTLDDQMLENLRKFVELADMYFVLTNPEVDKVKKNSVKFEDDINEGTYKALVVEGGFLEESARNSIMLRPNINEGEKDKGLIEVDKDIQEGLNKGILVRNSKTGSIIRVSQIKKPSEVFTKLKTKRKESLLRKKKSVIRKILYPIEETPLIEHEAHHLEIEQQLDLCLRPPMAWLLESKSEEEIIKEDLERENGEIEGNNEAIRDVIEGGEVKEGDESKNEDGIEEVQDEEEGEEEEPEEEVCKREHHHDLVENIKSEELKVYKIIKGEWTCPTFHAMLEYFYTERCHVPCEDVATLWAAAAQIMLQSLTNIIILHPIDEYLRLALKTEANRRSLLKLATISYKLDMSSNMGKLKRFCELFEYGGSQDCLPYTFTLFTSFILDREIECIEEGFCELIDLKVCILKVYDKKERLFAENANGLEFLTFEKRLEDQTHHRQYIREQWHGRKVDEPFLNNNKEKQWSITIFGPFIADECFKFYEYLVGQIFRIKEPETFSLHMPIPFLKQPVLHKAMKKAFPNNKLCIESNQGMSYYIGGETHGNSLTLTGNPLLILEAMKCIPRDMIGQTSLQFRAPTKRTFLKVFSVTRTIRIDIEKDQIFLLKNFKKIKLALEYFVDFSDTAFIPWNVPREFIELVDSNKPF